MTKEEREKKEAIEAAILAELDKLGGSHLTDDQVVHKGSQLVLPEAMTTGGAIEFLVEYRERMDSETSFSRTFRYRPWDGAVAFHRALIRLTGTTGLPKATFSFFGKEPPEMRTINLDVDETIQVPWGRIDIPMLNGQAYLGAQGHSEFGILFQLTIEAPRKFKNQIEGLFKLIEEELHTGSIYKGKAIDGQPEPEFIDLAGIDPRTVVYSDEAVAQLEANVWSVMRHAEKLKQLGIPRKRAILLEGPYGTGKTLAAFLTAQIAVQAGWTFLYCRPSRDDFTQVMATARLYQPSVVFFEDVDVMASQQDKDGISQLLDLFDGITAKGTEIMVVLTTNHKEQIHKGMVRPGRLDSVIHIGALDVHGVQRMIEVTVPSELLGEIDYDEVFTAMEGFLPAFVKEAIDRTMRYSIARNNGEVGIMGTGDFVLAATGLRPQLELMEGAKEGVQQDSLSRAMRDEVAKALHGAPIHDPNDNPVLSLQTNGH